MRKFKGQINGVEYTDMEEFEIALMQKSASPSDPISVSYTIEDTPDEQKIPFNEKSRTKPEDCNHDNLTDLEREKLCSAVENIRDIVSESTTKIDKYVGDGTQTYRNWNEFDSAINAAITKIRWIVQSLPAKLRKELCTSIYDATKEMVDNINSGLVDLIYETSKSQELISNEMSDIDIEIRDIEEDIEDLEREKSKMYDEINELQSEYDNNKSKIDHISTACKFFDNLIGTFEM